MGQWGNTDDAANSVTWATNQVRLHANSDNQTDLFGNTTADAFFAKSKIGQFGVSTAEASVGGATAVSATVTFPGSGYTSNATVTIPESPSGTNATANAQANSIGRISAVNITAPGSGYASITATIAAPSAIGFNGNTSVNTNGFIAIATNVLQVGDKVTYANAAGNTAVVGLTNGTQYFVQASNSTGVYLSATDGGAAITLTKGPTEAGHSLTGETATVSFTLGGGKNKGATPGWNLRTEGTGGRAGRVTYECLVAMGSITSDASDDTILPDS